MARFPHISASAFRGTSSVVALVIAGLAIPAYAQTTQDAPLGGGGTLSEDAVTDQVAQGGTQDTIDRDREAAPEDIIVTGTRASLASAISRKKNADTVVDSIVADDIASFPDKNVGEALGRITGVQLSREFGEGQSVSIRGVEPDLNRIEINGVSQQSAGGGRSGDFRELAVELVKSIDVYKGYTVDLTEGGIGGTVRVETRRPLELKDPIFSIKTEAQRLNLAEKWRPRLNLTAGRSDLLDGRLGVIFNVTHSVVDTRGDFAANTNWSRYLDFDRSAEKTVANPDFANFGSYESCAGVSGATAAARQTARTACESQFFDWSPGSVRYRTLDRTDARTSLDLQLQYALTDNFSVWGQAQHNYRNQTLRDANYAVNMGGGTGALPGTNLDITRYNLDAALPTVGGAISRPRPTQGLFTVDNHVLDSWTTQLNGINSAAAGATPNYQGANGIIGIQRRDFAYDEASKYYQAGLKWDYDRLSVVLLGSKSEASRQSDSNLVSITTGLSGITVDRGGEGGLPVISFPGSFDPADINSYADFTRRGGNGQLLTQTGPTVQYRPSEQDSSEDQVKLDIDYDLDWGFLTSVEVGGQYRDQNLVSYNNGGARLLSPEVRDPVTGAITQAAVYQYNNNVSFNNAIIGDRPAGATDPNQYYFTPAQYQQFLRDVGGVTGGAPLFGGLPLDGAPDRLAIPQFDFATLSRYYDLSGFNRDRLRSANDLPQIPAYIINEKIMSGYFKLNFGTDVFGMNLTGNAGVRYTHTRDASSSANTRRENRVRPGTGMNGIPAVIETATVAVQEISIDSSYHDWLPAVNFSLEALPNLFIRGTYAQNLARPRPDQLSPAVNCVIDIAETIAGDDTCVAGNPYLQPYRADQYDINAAWYPNADTVVSVGYYYKNITSFILPTQLVTGVDLFGDGQTFDVRQPVNGFGAKLDGVEVSAQTAFTFLPAPFDGFGVTGNFTFARAIDSGLTDQATGREIEEFPGLSKYTYNASFYYDKDWLNARINYNKRSSWLAVAADGANSNAPNYRAGETFVDAKVLFRLTPQHSVWIEALNLTGELQRNFLDDQRVVEYADFGRRIFLGYQLKL